MYYETSSFIYFFIDFYLKKFIFNISWADNLFAGFVYKPASRTYLKSFEIFLFVGIFGGGIVLIECKASIEFNVSYGRLPVNN